MRTRIEKILEHKLGFGVLFGVFVLLPLLLLIPTTFLTFSLNVVFIFLWVIEFIAVFFLLFWEYRDSFR